MENEEREECPFCSKSNLILRESKHTLLLVNKYPIGELSFLFVPKACKDSFAKMTQEEIIDFFHFMLNLTQTIEQELDVFEGLNIVINIGEIAGASEKHLHAHLIIRHCNDEIKNFVISGHHNRQRTEAINTALETVKPSAEEMGIIIESNGNPALLSLKLKDEKPYGYTQFENPQNYFLAEVIQDILLSLENSLAKPDGFNIFINQGKAGNQIGEEAEVNVLIRFKDDGVQNFARPNDGKIEIDPTSVEELRKILA